jgi:hypothetical protein
MGFAVAALGWRPREFWASTPTEYWTAVKAYERFHKQPDD